MHASCTDRADRPKHNNNKTMAAGRSRDRFQQITYYFSSEADALGSYFLDHRVWVVFVNINNGCTNYRHCSSSEETVQA